MSKACPSCELVHPPSALRCECGYDFRTKELPKRKVQSSTGLWHSQGLAVALLLLCWPIGLILLWQNRTLSKNEKVMLTVGWLALAAIAWAVRSRVTGG